MYIVQFLFNDMFHCYFTVNLNPSKLLSMIYFLFCVAMLFCNGTLVKMRVGGRVLCVWMMKVKGFGEDVWITSFVMTASEVLYDRLRVLGAWAPECQWLATTVILLQLSLSPVAVAEAIIQLSCFQHLVVDSDPEEWMQLISSNGTKYPGIFHL